MNHLGRFIPCNLSKEGAELGELGELGELEFSSRRPECIVSTRLDRLRNCCDQLLTRELRIWI